MKKILLATAAAAVISSSSAFADDMDTFFLKAQGGWSKFDSTKAANSSSLTSDHNGFLGLGAGYHVMDNVRVDLTFDYFFNPEHDATYTNTDGNKVTAKLKGKASTVLFNVFLDAFEMDMFKMFVGAGVGVSSVEGKVSYKFDNSALTAADDKLKQSYNAAFAGYVGFSYEVMEGLTADLTYSYRYMGDTDKAKTNGVSFGKAATYKSHNVGMGVRFEI